MALLVEFDASGEGTQGFGYQAVSFVFSQVTTLPGGSEVFSSGTPEKIARVGWFTPEASLDLSGGGTVVFAVSPFHWIDFMAQAVGIPPEANLFDSLGYLIYPGGVVHFWVFGP